MSNVGRRNAHLQQLSNHTRRNVASVELPQQATKALRVVVHLALLLNIGPRCLGASSEKRQQRGHHWPALRRNIRGVNRFCSAISRHANWSSRWRRRRWHGRRRRCLGNLLSRCLWRNCAHHARRRWASGGGNKSCWLWHHRHWLWRSRGLRQEHR